MVQGGFYGGFKSNFYGNNNNKTEAHFGPGGNLAGNQTGFKEEVFLPMVSGVPMSKNQGSVVKIDVGETAAKELPLRNKRTKNYHMGSPVTSTTFSQGLSLHPLEEPSPLGLTLKKTPSFIELIQMNLSQGDAAVPLVVNNSSLEVERKKDSKYAARRAIADKHKASNFPALLLRIGSWERTLRFEGDLVAKCYFAKRKLVWEVLEGGLKSKIEIQWSEITYLKAVFPNNEPATLEVEVSRPPLFFRETDPQPRKHTVWQATSDFTGGQASIRRRHLLQFAEGILERHYEKLLQCDDRLNLLSKEGIMHGDSPYFDSSGAVFQDQNEQSCNTAACEHKSHFFRQFDYSKSSYLPPFSSLPGTGFPRVSPPFSSLPGAGTPRVSPPFSSLPGAGTSRVSPLVTKLEPLELDGRVLDAAPQDTPSPCSVMDSRATEESGISDADDLHVNVTAKRNQMIFAAPYGGLGNKGSDLLSLKSMDTLVNRTVSRLAEKKFSHNLVPTGEETWQENKKIFDDIAHSQATEESGISDADGLNVNVTANHNQMIFAAPYGGLGNQDSDLLSLKSMDTLVNHTVSCLSEKKFSHNSVPTGEETWQASKNIFDEIAQHLLSDSFSSVACDEQQVMARVNSMYSLIEKDVSAAHASNGNTKSLENSGAGYGLGRLVKGEDDGQVCKRNDDMTEEVLSRDDRIDSQVNVMEDGYMHCKRSTGIPRQDSLGDLLVDIPGIASFPRLFVDSSGEFITSAEQPETAGWNPFQ